MAMSEERQKNFPEIVMPLVLTKRPISEGAELRLGVPVPCLDHGFLYLVDYMGNDRAVEQAARVSYGGGTRKITETEGLIRYLRRHQHTTPFEMAEVKFHARMPIFVARQWVRHRTASINEYSARYSIVRDEFHLPDPEFLGVQSKGNRQGRDELVDANYADEIRKRIFEYAREGYDLYQWLLNDDGTGKPIDLDRPMVAREIAREPLGVDFYTEWYWKVNLHNCFHFLQLRKDKHAQKEVRVYADAIGDIINDSFPLSYKAFEDYELNAIKFTAPEIEIITKLLEKRGIRFGVDELKFAAEEIGLKNKREQEEMLEKVKLLGIVS